MLELCRVCLEKSSKMYPLEGPILNVDIHVSTMITYCTSIEVALDEDLPKSVCLSCFKIIRIAYNFIKEFKENNRKLLAARELNRNKYRDVIEEKYKDDEEQLECKIEPEEVVEVDESEIDNLSDDTSNEKYFKPEENIIITYIDSSEEDKSAVAEVMPGNNEEATCTKEEVVLKEEESLSSSQDTSSYKYECPLCPDLFFTDFKRGLIKHLYRNHKDDSFKCDKCSLECKLTVDLYIQHYTRTHLYQCLICNKRLRSRSAFYIHSKCHSDGTHGQCPQQDCKKTFESLVSLRKHLQTHSDIAKYICSKCGKRFNTYDTFRYHNKTHDGNRSHLCTVCGRTFLQSVHLKYHMWHHTGIKQFRCADCDKSYTSVTQLKKHRRKYCGSGNVNEQLKP